MKLRAVKFACHAALLLGLIQGAATENSAQVNTNFENTQFSKKDGPGTVMPYESTDEANANQDEDRGFWGGIFGQDNPQTGTTTAPTLLTAVPSTTAPVATTATPLDDTTTVSSVASTTGSDMLMSTSGSAATESGSSSSADGIEAAATTKPKTKKTKKPTVTATTSASGSTESASGSAAETTPKPKIKKTKKPAEVTSVDASASAESASGSAAATTPKPKIKKTKKPTEVTSLDASASAESASGSASAATPKPNIKKTKKPAVATSADASASAESASGSAAATTPKPKTKKTKKPVVATSESASGSASSATGSAATTTTKPKAAKKTKKPTVSTSASASESSALELSGSGSSALDMSGSLDLSGSELAGSVSLTDSEMADLLGSSSGSSALDMSGSGLDMASGSSSDLDFGSLFGSMSGSGLADLMALFGSLNTPTNATVDDSNIVLSELLGGSEHGTAFSDVKAVKLAQVLANVTIRGNERVDALSLLVIIPEINIISHGGKGGDEKSIMLDMGEYINSVEVHWGKKSRKTTIFYMSMTSSKQQTVSAGTQTEDSSVLTAPEGYQLGGFYGRADDEIHAIGVIWTKRGASDLAVSDMKDVEVAKDSQMDKYKTTIRNWVGTIESGSDNACYRKKVDANSENVCPSGYEQKDDTCRAQCPLSYPVECVWECIPQSADCTTAIVAKVSSVALVALNALTAGVLGQVVAAYKVANRIVTCALNIANAVRSLIFYLRMAEATIPSTNTEKLMDYAFQLQIVTLDIPLAVAACLGKQIPKNLEMSATIFSVVSAIVMLAIMFGEIIIASSSAVMAMLKNVSLLNETAPDSTVTDLGTFLKSNSTCGYELKTLTNRVMGKVWEVRNNTPNADPDEVRVIISKSSVIIDDVPMVTNHCMGELLNNKTLDAAFETRNLLRKTIGVIIDDIIEEGTTDMGKHLQTKDKVLEYSNMGLFVLSMFDPTGIAWMASEFVQPVCGPSAYIGEIDDGTLYDALGLNTINEAFEGSYGVWSKKGDGSVKVIFESVDAEDVSVVIHSGGDTIATVKVGAGKTVTWSSTVEKLQDKTLYLDRWRPGFLGLPGSGGGSLLLWVPRSSEGGQLTLHARLNVS